MTSTIAMARTRLRDPRPLSQLPLMAGLSAIAFSVLYFASDVVELVQGGFSPLQLALTYAGEAAIPLFVLGLYAVQRPQIGRLGLAGAVLYAYAFVFFTGTVMVALVDGTRSWGDLAPQFGPWMLVHGGFMVLGGIALGLAVVQAGVFPRWTGWTLVVGVLLVALADSQPGVAQLAAAGIRDTAFIGMGLGALARWRTS